MTNQLTNTIEQAAVAAYEEGTDQKIGRINGKWAYTNQEDAARVACMIGPVFTITSEGPVSEDRAPAWMDDDEPVNLDDLSDEEIQNCYLGFDHLNYFVVCDKN